MKKKLLFLLASCCLFSTILGASVLSYAAESDEQTVMVETVTIQMEKGASIRYVEKAEGESDEDVVKKNGLRFMMCLTEADYQAIETENVSYGMLIAPADYEAFTPENVFGANGGTKLYDWATVVDGVSTYEPEKDENNENKYTRIINLSSPTMYHNVDKNRYEFSGSITAIKQANLDKKFQGLGYIAYTVDGVTNYRFATSNDNVRSVTYVAQLAVDANNKHKDELQAAYVTPVTDNERTYNVKHYIDGKFETTTTGTATIDDKVTIDTNDYYKGRTTANSKVITTATYDAENTNNVTTIKKVYADTTSTLKKYYTNKIVTGMIEKNVATSDSSIVENNFEENGTKAYKVTFKYDNALTASGWNSELRVSHYASSLSFLYSYQISKASDGTVSLYWRTGSNAVDGIKIQYTGEQATKLLTLLSEGNLNGYLIIDRVYSSKDKKLTDTFSMVLDIEGNGKYVPMSSASKSLSNVESVSTYAQRLGVQKQNAFEGTWSISFQNAEANYRDNIITDLLRADVTKTVSKSNSDTVTGFTIADKTLNVNGIYVLKLQYTEIEKMKNNEKCVLELRANSGDFFVAGALYYSKTNGLFFAKSRNDYADESKMYSFGTDNTNAIFEKLNAGTYTVVFVNDTSKENNLTVYADNGTGTLVKISETNQKFNLYKFGFSQYNSGDYAFGSKDDDQEFVNNAISWTANCYKDNTQDLAALTGLTVDCL